MTDIPGSKIEHGKDTLFDDCGYLVYRLGLEKRIIDGLKKIALEAKTEPIFNQRAAPNSLEEAKDNDRKRLMSKGFSNSRVIKNQYLKVLWRKLILIAGLHNREWKPFRMVVLRSEAGCGEQQTHTDGKGDDVEIGGILIAVEDNTFFHVNGRKLVLSAGDAVSFHGNTPHNGAAYENTNVRFHVYLAEKGGEVPKDEVGKFERVCHRCRRGFMSQKELTNHHPNCKGRTEEQIEEQKKRKRDNKRNQRAKAREPNTTVISKKYKK
jgi:uncharacterized cupin superfamily protein